MRDSAAGLDQVVALPAGMKADRSDGFTEPGRRRHNIPFEMIGVDQAGGTFADVDAAVRAAQQAQRQLTESAMEGRSAAAAFYGEEGTLVVDRGGWKVYDQRESITSRRRAKCPSTLSSKTASPLAASTPPWCAKKVRKYGT